MGEVTLFYATNNKSKLHNMYYRLQKYPIKVVCPDDLNIHLDIDENGTTAVENALLKAQAYYNALNIPTIAGDSGVYIEGISEEDQPGLYVRRIGGKVLSDDEMIDHYSSLAQKVKTDCFLSYFTGIALITEQGAFTTTLLEGPLKLSPTTNPNRNHRGNPLDVITQLEDGRFSNDLTDEERTERERAEEQKFTNFIISHLL